VDLPGEYKVSAAFNVFDLSPFDVGEDSWSNPFEKRGNDGNQGGPSLKDPLQVPDGPITRSRKQCKDWCNPLGMKLAKAQQSKWV
jgi:hypothetical protein